MLKKKLTSITAAVLAAALMSPASAFAAGTTGGTAADPVQAKSSETATLYVGKVLDVSQPDKFPSIEDYTFTVENVRAWDNANASASASGSDMASSDMPQPAEKTSDHHSVTRTDSTHASVTVGDFTGGANTDVQDTDTEKYRVTPVEITFEKAGYYMYKITENTADTGSVPGMSYDRNSYYAVIYVCNKTDAEGNTIGGVYVHDITAYRNNEETDYNAYVSDIHNTTDNGGTAAAENDYTNMAKVGNSPDEEGTDPVTGNPVGPDKLETFRFFNDQTTHDVVVTNNVTGNLGDITKEFEYTVTLTGLEKNKQYTTNTAAQGKDASAAVGASTSSSADIEALETGGLGTVDAEGKSFTSDDSGNAIFRIKLADDETMVLNALPAGSTYKVEELASDHVTSYTSESTEPDSWQMTEGGSQKANTINNTALSTNEETVDAVSNVAGRENSEDNDGTVTINFRNHRDLATVTGLPYYGDFVYALTALVIAGLIILIARRRRSRVSGE